MMIFSQINGVNMILLYGPTILNDAGISFGSNSVLSSFPTYLTIFVATLISFPLINRYSRRGLLIASVLGMAFSHLLMATLLAVHAPALTVLIPMMLGAGTFTLGLAPLSWIIVSEIFPNRVQKSGARHRVRVPVRLLVCDSADFPDGDGLAAADHRHAGPHVRRVCADLRVLRALYLEDDARRRRASVSRLSESSGGRGRQAARAPCGWVECPEAVGRDGSTVQG